MSRVYLDHAATSPLLPEVLEAMSPWLRAGRLANPSSLHREGRLARAAVDGAREEVAAALGVEEDEVLFTGSGTESDNLAIRGLAWMAGAGAHVVSSAIEHEAVLRTLRWLESRGEAEPTLVAPGPDGTVALEDLLALTRKDTALVSLMAVNNETGIVQPVAELAEALAERGLPLHVDAVQALGRLPLHVPDLLSLSAHKVGGPPGLGVLVVRRGLKLQPVLTGGDQEEGLRPGTESVAAILGGARAVRLAVEERELRSARLRALDARLAERLRRLPAVSIHGEGAARVPGLLNLDCRDADASLVMQALDLRGFAVSTGSACSSGSTKPSHVLVAQGLSRERARSALRVSLGSDSREESVDAFAETLEEVLDAVRSEVRT